MLRLGRPFAITIFIILLISTKNEFLSFLGKGFNLTKGYEFFLRRLKRGKDKGAGWKETLNLILLGREIELEILNKVSTKKIDRWQQ
jgi:hypothetical protein